MKSTHSIAPKDKIKLTAVSYLNTKPLLYGLFKSELSKYIDLELNIPSVCAQKLKRGEVDLALVPVAIIPELEQPQIVTDYCIGAIGSVKTVCIYSDYPIQEITHLYLDYHSRTSVALTKVLLKKHWQLNPILINAQPGYEQKIQGKKAGLIIGDRAIGLEEKYEFCYDLGEEWMKMTGLPFVFAAWVANKPIPEGFINQFNLALQRGIEEIPQLMYILPTPKANFDLVTYFTEYISYELDGTKRKGLSLFIKLLRSINQTETPAISPNQELIFQ